ncbi:MAG: AbiV family abortive infection protein [Candidatus Thorarchaeota archaeon]
MKRKEAYCKSYIESLRNAETWLDDAELLSRNNSTEHARALVIFAGEEIGKATTCWLAVNKVLPFNHPEVDFTRKTSVFRSHDLKNEGIIGLIYSIADIDVLKLAVAEKEKSRSIQVDPSAKYGIGRFATEARSRWMYVSIEGTKSKGYEVNSPLLDEPGDPIAIIKTLRKVIETLREMESSGFADSPQFKKFRNDMIALDPTFPENPEWD